MEPIEAPEVGKVSEEAEPTAPAESKRRRLGKSDMEKRRPRRRALVYLPERDGEVEIQELRPGDLAEINAKCVVKKKDDQGNETIDWDGRKRAFYMVAKALLNENGKPLYPGENYLYGAELIASDYDQDEVDLLFAEVQRLTGYTKEARDAAKKGSSGTTSGEPS